MLSAVEIIDDAFSYAKEAHRTRLVAVRNDLAHGKAARALPYGLSFERSSCVAAQKSRPSLA